MSVQKLTARLMPPKNCVFIRKMPNGVSLFQYHPKVTRYTGEKLRKLRAERGVGNIRKFINQKGA